MINYVHHSGRFDKSPADLIKGFDQDRVKKNADIIAFTELTGEPRATALGARTKEVGWGFFRARGAGKEDCGLAWDAKKYTLIEGYGKVLTGIDTFRPDGHERAPFGAMFAVLKELATGDLFIFCVAHTPSHVEEGTGWQENNRALQHRVGCRRINKDLRTLRRNYREVASVISMDLNLNIKKRWVKAYLATTFPKFRLMIDNNPEGTHGDRTIDAVLVTRRLGKRGRVDAYRVPDSDHKAIIVRLVRRALNK